MKTELYKITGICIVTMALFLMCSSQKYIPVSQWRNTPIIIDGDLTDWEMPLSYYDRSCKIAYSILNDSNNLYFCMSVPDETMQMKILRAGMFLSVDTTGKKNNTFSINYPLSENIQLSRDDRTSQPDFSTFKSEFKQNVQMMLLSGFPYGNGMVPTQASNGVIAKLDWTESNEMAYEVCIPLQSFRNHNLRKADSIHVISLSVRIPALEPPAFVRSGGGPPSGVGGRPGGGGPPSWVTSGGADFSLLTEEQNLYQKFYLKLK